MSGARESGLWKWLRKAEKTFRDRLDMNRVENSLGSGMPDVEGVLDAHQFWIELKSTARPTRETTPVRFAVRDREAQERWLARRWRFARNTWLLCQVGERHKAVRYLIPGDYAASVYAGVTEDELAAMSVNEGTENAEEIVALAAEWRVM